MNENSTIVVINICVYEDWKLTSSCMWGSFWTKCNTPYTYLYNQRSVHIRGSIEYVLPCLFISRNGQRELNRYVKCFVPTNTFTTQNIQSSGTAPFISSILGLFEILLTSCSPLDIPCWVTLSFPNPTMLVPSVLEKSMRRPEGSVAPRTRKLKMIFRFLMLRQCSIWIELFVAYRATNIMMTLCILMTRQWGGRIEYFIAYLTLKAFDTVTFCL